MQRPWGFTFDLTPRTVSQVLRSVQQVKGLVAEGTEDERDSSRPPDQLVTAARHTGTSLVSEAGHQQETNDILIKMNVSLCLNCGRHWGV